jgi:hypothetical protein
MGGSWLESIIWVVFGALFPLSLTMEWILEALGMNLNRRLAAPGVSGFLLACKGKSYTLAQSNTRDAFDGAVSAQVVKSLTPFL